MFKGDVMILILILRFCNQFGAIFQQESLSDWVSVYASQSQSHWQSNQPIDINAYNTHILYAIYKIFFNKGTQACPNSCFSAKIAAVSVHLLKEHGAILDVQFLIQKQ